MPGSPPPYDTDARWGVKRGTFWLGYKLHVTETCDDQPPCSCPAAGGPAGRRRHDQDCAAPAFPNVITHVATTDATVTGNQMTSAIDDELAGKTLGPGRHYVDSGLCLPKTHGTWQMHRGSSSAWSRVWRRAADVGRAGVR
jgi:hypothetical protein